MGAIDDVAWNRQKVHVRRSAPTPPPGGSAMIMKKPRWPMRAGALCFAAILGGRAGAAEVYPGCPVPPTTFNHIWYIDPVNGKTLAVGGLGTQAAPWNSLQAAFSVQHTASLERALPAPESGQPRQHVLP